MLEKLKLSSDRAYLLWFGVPVLLYQILISRILSQIFGSLFFIQLFLIAVAYLGTSLGSYYALRWKFTLSSSHLLLLILNVVLLAFSQNDTAVLQFPSLSLILGFTLFFLISFFSSLLLPLYFERQKNLTGNTTPTFNRVYFYFHLLVVFALIFVELDLLVSWGIHDILASLALVELIWGLYWWNQDRSRKAAPPTAALSLAQLRTASPVLLPLFIFSIISGVIQSILYRQVQNFLAPLAFHYSLYLAALILSWAISSLWFRSPLGYRFLNWQNFRSKSAVLLLALLVWALAWPTLWAALLDGFGLSTNYHEELNSLIKPSQVPVWVFMIRAIFTFGLVFPFGFFFGSLLPLVQKENGKIPLGVYLSINSLGNALGILLFISVLFEMTGIFQLWGLLALACLIFASQERRQKVLTITTVLSLGLLTFSLNRTYSWDLGSFSMRGLQRWLEDTMDISGVQVFKHRSSQVTFVEFNNRYYRMFMNGHTSVVLPKSDPLPLTDTLMGLTPMGYVNHFDNSLVIGLGTGATTLGSAALFNHTDIVDLDPTMLQVVGSLEKVSAKLLRNSKVQFTEADGLTYLRTTPKKYDLILNNVPSPVYFAAAKLWSREALEAVHDRLNDDGIFAQWLDGELSPQALDSLMQTSEGLFSHCDLYILNFEFYSLICSKGDAPLKLKEPPKTASELMNTTPEKYAKFMEALRFPAVSLTPMDSEIPVNTLNQPYIDVLVARNPPGWLYNSQFDTVARRFKIPEAITAPDKLERCQMIKGWLYLRQFETVDGVCAELF